MSETPTPPADPFTHRDGRVCHWYAYARDDIKGLLHGYFHGAPPELRKCHREHGLQGAEDEGPQT